jgi:hypothetical protein
LDVVSSTLSELKKRGDVNNAADGQIRSAFLYRGGAEGYTDYPVLPSGDTRLAHRGRVGEDALLNPPAG